MADGAFRFEGVAENPQVAILRDARDDGATFGAMLILEPGTINVADDAQNPYRKKVTGTPANDASDAYATAGNTLVQEFRNPETTSERREAIEQEYEQLTRTVLDQNRDNLFGVMLLAQQLGYELSGQELLDEIAKFPAAMQQTDALVKLKGERRTEDENRHRPAVHRHRTAQCRRRAGIARIGGQEPGEQIRPAGFLGFVVRPLHGRSSPPEEDLRGFFTRKASKSSAYRSTRTAATGSAPSNRTAWTGCTSAR